MRNEVLSGGPNLPVTFAGRQLKPLPDLPLKDGLLGVAGPMAIKNRLHLGDVALASSGARMSGSAGMEFIEVALGRQVGYVPICSLGMLQQAWRLRKAWASS